jgi:two-component sensor histidine kinase
MASKGGAASASWDERSLWMKMVRGRWVADRPAISYSLAIAISAVALALRVATDPFLPPGFPFLTFFPAVIITTFVCGLWPGILCGTLCFFAAWYFFIEPRTSMILSGAAVTALAFYVFIVAVDIALIHGMRKAAERLELKQRVVEDLLARQNVMFQELQHRVANNMQFVSSLLLLQRRKVEADTQAAEVLEEARSRIDTIGRIHRRLYDPDRANLPAAPYLQALCDDVLEASGQARITCTIRAPDVCFDLTQLTALSLLVAELATNAVKHAFPAEQNGTLTVALEPLEQPRWRLTVSDDGRGLPAEFGTTSSPSLGLRIVQGLARQLGGEIRFESARGTRAIVEFARA